MEITKTREGNKLTMALEGSLDATTAFKFDKELTASLDGVTEFVLDMEKLEYISSAGLRVLLAAQKTMNDQGTMEVVHVMEDVMDILKVTGFADALTIRP